MLPKRVRATLLPLLLAGAQACATGGAAPAPSGVPVDADLALLTFDSAWSRIAATHYDTTFQGVDWAGVRRELRPHAAAARTLDELRRVIDDMLGRLGESHYALIRAEAVDRYDGGTGTPGSTVALRDAAVAGEAGLEVRLVDGELLAWRLAEGGAAEAAGIAPGWSLLSVAGRPVGSSIEALASLPERERRVARTRLLHTVNASLRGSSGDALTLQLRDARGREVERTLLLRPSPGQVVTYGNLPPLLAHLDHHVQRNARGCVGIIRLHVWAVPLLPAFDAAIDSSRDCAGIIVDLRGNPGGVAGMIMGAAGHFVNDTVALGHLRTRDAELRYMANPRRVRRDGTRAEPFTGPLAILVDEMSASTSEIFAAALQATGRARVFGQVSAGQALPALMLRLPTGDVLLHVVADFTGPGGVRLEGRGVVPDEAVPLTRVDLLGRRDATLAAAMDWIQSRGAREP